MDGTDHFILKIVFSTPFGDSRSGIFPEYPPRVRQSGWDPALRVVKEGRPLIQWRRQEREDRSANGWSQIPGQRSPMGQRKQCCRPVPTSRNASTATRIPILFWYFGATSKQGGPAYGYRLAPVAGDEKWVNGHQLSAPRHRDVDSIWKWLVLMHSMIRTSPLYP